MLEADLATITIYLSFIRNGFLGEESGSCDITAALQTQTLHDNRFITSSMKARVMLRRPQSSTPSSSRCKLNGKRWIILCTGREISDLIHLDVTVPQAGYKLKFKGLGVMNSLTVSAVTCLRRS